MKRKTWFSSKVRLICQIESIGSHCYMDSIFVFRSEDFEVAFNKALQLGRTLEKSYYNENNEKVVWLLKEIVSLDMIVPASLDGVEVYSEPVQIPDFDRTEFLTHFEPEKSIPTQSI